MIITCDDDGDKLGAEVTVGGQMTGVWMSHLLFGGHYTLLGAEEV